MRVDDAVGAVSVHGVAGFLGLLWVGVFAAGYPTGINNVESSIGGQLMGMATFLPLGFLSGYLASFVLRKLNLLRVPAEVELEGLDPVEYGTLVYPEMGVIKEQVVEPDGTLVETATVTQLELTNGRGATDFEELRR
jgi:ammonia channel protein AmtB